MSAEAAASRRIVLASASPRRLALLESAGYEVTVRPSGADEGWPTGAPPERAVVELALRKLRAVVSSRDDRPVLGADTEVILDGEPLGKPRSRTAARAMLERMSGRTHRVLSGVAVGYRGRERTGVAQAEVTFRTLEAGEIEAYLEGRLWIGKAGAYGIQDDGGLVSAHTGRLDTVIGLPMDLVDQLLTDLLKHER